MVHGKKDSEPHVGLEQVSCVSCSAPNLWRIAWEVQNLGEKRLEVLSGRLPHGKFRSEEQEFNPGLEVPPNHSAELEFTVKCGEKPGTEVENAFLILRVIWLDEPWWIFIRLRVIFNQRGEPETVTELVTAKRVGFSEG